MLTAPFIIARGLGGHAVPVYWVQPAFHLQTCAMIHAMRNRTQETQHAMRQEVMVTACMCYVGCHQTGQESHSMLECGKV